MKMIEHYISGLGLVNIPLFDPAPAFYGALQSQKEITRLNKLRHLGAIGPAFHGIRQARWDYTVAMLYFASKLICYGSSSKIKFAQSECSSLNAALQMLALAWNIGHLPGTFGTEKGVLRYLRDINPTDPASVLIWPNHDRSYRDELVRQASNLTGQSDYQALARVLAVKKLFAWELSVDGLLKNHFRDWMARFLLQSYTAGEPKFEKIQSAWNLIRHAAYLTIDLPMSGLHWSVNIPRAFESICINSHSDANELASDFSESIAQTERQLFHVIYFSANARKETTITAHNIYEFLKKKCNNPEKQIDNWLCKGLLSELRTKRWHSNNYSTLCSTKWRSMFYFSAEPLSDIETQLRTKTKQIAGAMQYDPWSSPNILDAPEIFIDVYGPKQYAVSSVGKVMCWLFDKHDEHPAERSDLNDAVKRDLSRAYFDCMKRLTELLMPECTLKLDPWPLNRFGINLGGEKGVGIWSATNDLNDVYTKFILRDRSKSVNGAYKTQYNELLGLKNLRSHLKKEWGLASKRHLCFLISASIKVLKKQKSIIEFDGGLLTISRRSGKVVWYGLESKSGSENPAASLQRRLNRLQIKAEVCRLKARYAVAKMTIA
ncbi:MAG: hypothetical protein ACRETQ_08180 [Gammaproteobacteria bacterium]